MDAKTLFRQGVRAIQEQKDLAQGRTLLTQSLKLDPNNDAAWLWLTRTIKDPQKKLQCVERALHINPSNEHARKLKEQLQADTSSVPNAAPAPEPAPAHNAASSPVIVPLAGPAVPAEPTPQPRISGATTMDTPLTRQESEQMQNLLEQAEIYLAEDNVEEAIASWVEVLQIRVDYELAIRNAAGHLWRLNYKEDAREIVQRAIDAGTSISSIYMTAIDMAERERDYEHAEAIRLQIVEAPHIDDQLIVTVANGFLDDYKIEQGREFLERAVELHPESQALLVRLGDLYRELEHPADAMACYNRAVQLGTRSKHGKEADRRLQEFVPVLTDRERGSMLLAVREVIGLSVLYLLIAWQDAGLYLNRMNTLHWLGVGLSFLGGYLLVTAVSSPQQHPLAWLLGGKVPGPDTASSESSEDGKKAKTLGEADPEAVYGAAIEDPTQLPIIPLRVRYVLGVMGVVLLGVAAYLVLSESFNLVFDYQQPYNKYFNPRPF
jgi:tetratricopeptide (TPR) repeat protein